MSERLAIGLSYDGTRYHGWQWQPDVPTLQTELERALANMTGDSEIKAICAGRTDKGVHALNQIIHFDSSKQRSEFVWINGLNAHLPRDIRVHWAKQVPSDFHARFSAIQRHYRYLIFNHPISLPHLQKLSTWVSFELNAEIMHQAAQLLLGEHDFSSFRGAHCQSNTPVRNVHSIEISRKGKLIQIDIKANAFLHHMVRNIVGTLLLVGRRKQPIEWVKEVLLAKDRTLAGMTAPAEGLYFMNVSYPTDIQFPTDEASKSLELFEALTI